MTPWGSRTRLRGHERAPKVAKGSVGENEARRMHVFKEAPEVCSVTVSDQCLGETVE